MDALPFEILSHISDFLPPKELIHFYSASTTLSSHIPVAASRVQVDEWSCVNLCVANYSSSAEMFLFLRVSIGGQRASTWKIRGRGTITSLIGSVASSPFLKSVIKHFLTIHLYKCRISSDLITEIDNLFASLTTAQLFLTQDCTFESASMLSEMSRIAKSFPFSTRLYYNDQVCFGHYVKIKPDKTEVFSNPFFMHWCKASLIESFLRGMDIFHLKESQLSDFYATTTSLLLEGLSLEEYNSIFHG